MKTQKARICPKCGSPKIRESKSSVSGWLVPTTYYCEADGCGYSGSVYVEVDPEELEHLQKVINGEENCE